VQFSPQVSTDSGERNSGQNPQAVHCLKRTRKTTIYYRCQTGDSDANFGCTSGRICNGNFSTLDRAIFPLKHTEMLAAWKCSKMATKWILKVDVQLPEVQYHLTEARPDIIYITVWSCSTASFVLCLYLIFGL
jgi:hypothetical protein